MDIHQRIKSKRLEKGLSMQAVADFCGLKSWQSVQQWELPDEAGGTTPRRTALALLADLLEVSPQWIQFGDEGAQSSGPKTLRRDKHPWPFRFTADQFSALPRDRQERINAYAQGVIEEWEASHTAKRGKTA
jgi:transcriptional regulator with XRE-family HTH domain